MKRSVIFFMVFLILLGLGVPAWAASEVYGPFRITIPGNLKAQNLSWVDQDEEKSGIQIDVLAKLSDDHRKVEVYGNEGSYLGEQPTLGYFKSKSVGDSYYLKYSIVYVRRFGQGIQIQVTTIENTADNYNGSKADIINFRDNYPIGSLLTYTLEWSDSNGQNIEVAPEEGYLSNWKQMHRAGSCNALQINPLIGHILCDTKCDRVKEYPH